MYAQFNIVETIVPSPVPLFRKRNATPITTDMANSTYNMSFDYFLLYLVRISTKLMDASSMELTSESIFATIML